MIRITEKIVEVAVIKGKETHRPPQTEEIIQENVRLPADSPARMKVLRAEGRKWYLTVVYHEESKQPFALFCHTNNREKTAQTSDAVERLLVLAKQKRIPQKYIKGTIEKFSTD